MKKFSQGMPPRKPRSGHGAASIIPHLAEDIDKKRLSHFEDKVADRAPESGQEPVPQPDAVRGTEGAF